MPRRPHRSDGRESEGVDRDRGQGRGQEGAQRLSDARLGSGTGRSAAEWFARLDAAGAARLSHTQIARLLVDEFEVAPWWAQGITVRYEQERGLGVPGQLPDGSFEVSVSRSLQGSPLELLDLGVARFAGYAGGAPGDVSRSSSRPRASWTLDNGDTLVLEVAPPAGRKCAVTLTQGHLRLPERVQPVKEGLTRAFDVMIDRQN